MTLNPSGAISLALSAKNCNFGNLSTRTLIKTSYPMAVTFTRKFWQKFSESLNRKLNLSPSCILCPNQHSFDSFSKIIALNSLHKYSKSFLAVDSVNLFIKPMKKTPITHSFRPSKVLMGKCIN
jgi:hypothetical protein